MYFVHLTRSAFFVYFVDVVCLLFFHLWLCLLSLSLLNNNDRAMNKVSKFTDITSYLRYAKVNGTDPSSTVFQGTVYELFVKESLERDLSMSRVVHYGGSFDNGRDLAAKWDLEKFRSGCDDASEPLRVRGRSIKPILQRKSTLMDVLVQCKSQSTKITAREIRELEGTFNFNVNRSKRYTSMAIMCSPCFLTSQGHEQMFRSEAPLMYCQIKKPKLRTPGSGDPYCLEDYLLDEKLLMAYFMNPLSMALLNGTSLSLSSNTSF